jgi:hypothetical protein
MKTWIIILGMIATPLLVISQSSQTVKNFFSKYQNNDRAEQLKIGGLVLDLAISFSDDDDNKKILKKLKRLRLLSFEDTNPVDPTDFRQLMKGIQADRYSPLIKLRQKGGETVDIFVQEKNNYISEVLLIVQSQEEFILLNLEGKFRFEDLNDFDLDTKGGDHLRRLPEKRSELPKA